MLSGIAEVRAGLLALDKKVSDPSSLLPLDYMQAVFRRISRAAEMRFERHPAMNDLLRGLRAIMRANPDLKKPDEFGLFERAYDYFRRFDTDSDDLHFALDPSIHRIRRPESDANEGSSRRTDS